MNIRILIEIKLSDTVTKYYAQEDTEFPASGSKKHYEGRLRNSGQIESSLTDMYYGSKRIAVVSTSFDNTDMEFRKLRDIYEFRGKEQTIKRADLDADTVIESHTLTIMDSPALNLNTANLRASLEEHDVWDTTMPKNRITTGIFPDADESALGKPISVWFGPIKEIPCHCIQEELSPDTYDYLLGYGTLNMVTAVYREGDGTKVAVNDSNESGTTTGKATNKLIDSGATFQTSDVTAKMVVKNTTDDTHTIVSSVDSETQLTLADDNFDTGEGYEIYLEYLFYDGSQESPFAGYAFIRFALEQRDTNANLYNITADIEGIKINGVYERNPVTCIQEFIINQLWGLGLTIEWASFNTAAESRSNSKYYISGGLHEFKKANEYRDYFLTACVFAKLNNTDDGYEITIPEYKSTNDANFDEYNMTLINDRKRAVSEYAKETVLHYQYRLDSGKYNEEIRKSTGKDFGIVKDYYSPFTYYLLGADEIATYINNKFKYQDRHIELSTTHDAKSLSENDVVGIDYDALGISGGRYEVINIKKKAHNYVLNTVEYLPECDCFETCYGYSACTCDNECYSYQGCQQSCDNACYEETSGCTCDSTCYQYQACTCNSTCYEEGMSCFCDNTCYSYQACICNYTCYGDTSCENCYSGCDFPYYGCSCYSGCYGYRDCHCNNTCYGYVACECDNLCYQYQACQSCDNTCYEEASGCTCNLLCYQHSCTCNEMCYTEASCTCNYTIYDT